MPAIVFAFGNVTDLAGVHTGNFERDDAGGFVAIDLAGHFGDAVLLNR